VGDRGLFLPKLLLTAFFAVAYFYSPPAHAEKRVALVIGNAAYKNAVTLQNPRNDAQDVSAALQRLGFETIVGLDLDDPCDLPHAPSHAYHVSKSTSLTAGQQLGTQVSERSTPSYQNRRAWYVQRPRRGDISHPLMLCLPSAIVNSIGIVRIVHATDSVALFPTSCPEIVLQVSRVVLHVPLIVPSLF
jgi:hypothetical protein